MSREATTETLQKKEILPRDIHDPYRMFGLSKRVRLTDETLAAVKKMRGKMAQKYHPDIPANKELRADFEAVEAAYRTLTDPVRLERYLRGAVTMYDEARPRATERTRMPTEREVAPETEEGMRNTVAEVQTEYAAFHAGEGRILKNISPADILSRGKEIGEAFRALTGYVDRLDALTTELQVDGPLPASIRTLIFSARQTALQESMQASASIASATTRLELHEFPDIANTLFPEGTAIPGRESRDFAGKLETSIERSFAEKLARHSKREARKLEQVFRSRPGSPRNERYFALIKERTNRFR